VSEGVRAYAVLALIAAGIMAAVGLTSDGWVGPVREYSGRYSIGFEIALFVEGATNDIPSTLNDDNHGYLAPGSVALPPDPCAVPANRSRMSEDYAIRFIGRRKRGAAGHLGMSPAEYLVERVIEIRPIDRSC
jgi:hypothetical protein